MAYSNAVQRIKRLGLRIAVVGALLLVLVILISLYANTGGKSDGFDFFVVCVPLFFGGVVYLFGWFLEGFLRPAAKHR